MKVKKIVPQLLALSLKQFVNGKETKMRKKIKYNVNMKL